MNLPAARKQTLRFSPRYGNPGSFDLQTVEPGVQRLVYTGGLIINVTYETDVRGKPQMEEYEFAADNLVIWIRGLKGADLLGGVSVEPNAPPAVGGEKPRIELFLNGNVIVRNKDEVAGLGGAKQVVTRTIRADQLYYDVEQSKAIATKADLEMKFDTLTDAVHMYGKRIERLGPTEWKAYDAGLFSSKLPYDPAVRLRANEATLTEQQTTLTNVFGIPYKNLATGEQMVGNERILTARNTRIDLLGVPIFYTPYYRGDISEPLGPLVAIGAGNDRIFGAQVLTTWDMFRLLALKGPPGQQWQGHLDYLSKRGVDFGTTYRYAAPDFFGFGGPSRGQFLAYGISDNGVDILGGMRGPEPPQPQNRGRVLWRNQTEWFADRDADGIFSDRYLTLQTGFAYLTDKNYLEEYYKQEFDHGPNQETFAFLSGSRGQFYGSVLAQGGLERAWITEAQMLPNVTGAVVGQSFFDLFGYEARAGAAYARLRPATLPPAPYLPTDQRIDTGRFDLLQELSLPFNAGPVKINPYALLDLTQYTSDLNGNSQGRVYGGGGVRSSLTVSRTFSDVNSEIFNLRGLNHKATFYSNYFWGQSNVSYNQLPQIDRLNDDTLDQGMRTMNPFFPTYIPGADGLALQSGQQFNPQLLAIRRLVMNRIDTRDDMQVVQTGLFQRLQTKRGLPGNEHTVDWMSLDLTASFFPDPSRDNFGKNAAFLEFNYLWNVGDQTAISAQGWFDPYDPGTNYWNIGTYMQRPDGVNFYAGYRQTDPLNSKTVTMAVNYNLSKKYSMAVGTSYDFGNQLALSNSFTVFRTGTDLTVGLGFNYNALVNNFGVQFVLVPNVAQAFGIGRLGNTLFAGR